MHTTPSPCMHTGSPLLAERTTSPNAEDPVRNGSEVDWLDTLLQAQAQSSHSHDTAFVAQVMSRLPVSASYFGNNGISVTIWSQRLLWGFEILLVAALCLAGPSAFQALSMLLQLPDQAMNWQNPNLWGFMLGVSMLTWCGIELASPTDETRPT